MTIILQGGQCVWRNGRTHVPMEIIVELGRVAPPLPPLTPCVTVENIAKEPTAGALPLHHYLVLGLHIKRGLIVMGGDPLLVGIIHLKQELIAMHRRRELV